MSNTDNVLGEIQRAVGNCEGKLDMLIAAQVRQLESQQAQDNRIGSLEASRNWATGYVVGVSTAVGFLINFIFQYAPKALAAMFAHG